MSFEHKKSLGQNFLNSNYVPKKMCDAGEVSTGDYVLEIGPGTGALTRELLARGATVTALEADPRAIEVLEESFATEIAQKKLILHHGDARTLNVNELGLEDGQYKVIANIPYYLSGLLFRTILESKNQPNTLVFLIQKELAERIARDQKESLLSLSVKVFGKPIYVTTVTKAHFSPSPKVDSAILAVRGISRDNFTDISMREFFTVLHLGFGNKRKQLQGNLSQMFNKAIILGALSDLGLPTTVRAEDIPLQTWLTFIKQLKTKSK